MTQDWFEMKKLRTKDSNKDVWIPLFEISTIIKEGKYGYEGYKEEFFGAGSVCIPIDDFDKASNLSWMDVGISRVTKSYIDENMYFQGDLLNSNYYGISGFFPVLIQEVAAYPNHIWHVHQDIIIALDLVKENDSWIAPNEDFIEVIKLTKDDSGLPKKIEIRNDFLKDYLCARGMGLFITTYRNRDQIISQSPDFNWDNGSQEITNEQFRWAGRISPIHQGGEPFGESMLVIHSSRTDVDLEDDVPTMGIPSDENIEYDSWGKKFEGTKLFRVSGELWKNHLILPGEYSEIIKGDECLNPPMFIVDASGKQENQKNLADGGKWLWFNPQVINELLNKRGFALEWYTRETGAIISPSHDYVTFGINSIGLINAYSKDIAFLPVWQQKIWTGYNVRPEGKISYELYQSQVKAEPAETQAPEAYIGKGLNLLNDLFIRKYGFLLFNYHQDTDNILKKIHRFRSYNEDGFFSLAKDIARLTADSINSKDLNSNIAHKEKLGSIKSLEYFIGEKANLSLEEQRKISRALVGIYELRHMEAHLPGSNIDEAYSLAGVDKGDLPILKGFQIIDSFVSTLFIISTVLK